MKQLSPELPASWLQPAGVGSGRCRVHVSWACLANFVAPRFCVCLALKRCLGSGCPGFGLPAFCGSRCVRHRHVTLTASLYHSSCSFNEAPELPYTSPNRRSFEALLRKLLRMPRSPAVVVLHHYGWYHRWEGCARCAVLCMARLLWCDRRTMLHHLNGRAWLCDRCSRSCS